MECAELIYGMNGNACEFNGGGGIDDVLYIFGKSQLTGIPPVDADGSITNLVDYIDGTLKKYTFLEGTGQYLENTEGDTGQQVIQTLNGQLSYALLTGDNGPKVKKELAKFSLTYNYALVGKGGKYRLAGYGEGSGRGLKAPGGSNSNDTLAGVADVPTITLSLVGRANDFAPFVTDEALQALLESPAGTSGSQV